MRLLLLGSHQEGEVADEETNIDGMVTSRLDKCSDDSLVVREFYFFGLVGGFLRTFDLSNQFVGSIEDLKRA